MTKLSLTSLSIRFAIVLVALLTGSRAEALTIRLCECSLSSPDFNPGDTLTLGFRFETGPGEQIFGLGASVYGYDGGVVDFVSGESVSSIFHGAAIPAIGAFDGLRNLLIPAPAPGVVSSGPLSESFGLDGNRVQIFNSGGLSPTQSNALDPGLDGVIGGDDAQVRVRFIATGGGFTNLWIGTGYDGDGVILAGGQVVQSNTIQLTLIPGFAPICTIPEPGTALLLGLGLAGLVGNPSSSGAQRARSPRTSSRIE